MRRNIDRIVEEQIMRWRLERKRLENRREPPAPRPNAITIGHAFGARGAQIAVRVGEILRLPVFDREIIKHVAHTAHVSLMTVETLDEHVQGRLEDFLTSLVREQSMDSGDYLRALARTLAALWEHGPCVLVGHGCVHVVPRTSALAVRLVASKEARVACIADRQHLEERAARHLVAETDAEREGFHRRYFKAEINDPTRYDLMLDSTYLKLEACAQIIAEAFRQKFRAQ